MTFIKQELRKYLNDNVKNGNIKSERDLIEWLLNRILQTYGSSFVEIRSLMNDSFTRYK